MNQHFQALRGKLNFARLNSMLAVVSIVATLLCVVGAGIQFGPIGAVVLAALMPWVPRRKA